MNNPTPKIKAISLWQPWATLIALGGKTFETRSWSTSHRGPLIIHAAKRTVELEQCRRMYRIMEANMVVGGLAIYPFVEEATTVLKAHNQTWNDMPLGAAICICDLTDCIPTSVYIGTSNFITPNPNLKLTERERHFGNYSAKRFAWKLENVRVFKVPVPYKGRQGMWDWDLPLPE